MLLFYLRHGEPNYETGKLTPLGTRQAEALAKRLALFGIYKIYASTSERAILTAQPLCDILRKEPELLPFCDEKYAAEDFMFGKWPNNDWVFHHKELKSLILDPDVIAMGYNWYKHPSLAPYPSLERGIKRVSEETDNWLKSLGFDHEQNTGRYKVTGEKYSRVALFAHQGFGMAFLSCLLDIPYPLFATRFDLCHSSMTVIDFKDQNGYAIPKVLTLSSDSHLYKDGLPLRYNGNPNYQF